MPYDITDAKSDIELLYREVATLEDQLIKKNILEQPKEKENNEVKEEK